MEIIMELLEIAKKRHSVRKYTGKEIEQEKLDKILEAAHVAPTAANMQPVRLIVVKSKETPPSDPSSCDGVGGGAGPDSRTYGGGWHP